MRGDGAGGHGRIADIELLRGVAILFVLLEHAQINLFPWIGLGQRLIYVYFGFWSGVDLFFAISGFVIARSLLPVLEAAGGSLEFFNQALAFWVRRAWRLLPSAWLWLGLIMLGVLFCNRSGAFGSVRANFEAGIAAILDIANFRIIGVFGQFPSGDSFPYWSLSLEEQFYVVLPFVVFFAGRRLPWFLGAVILLQFFVARSGNHASAIGLIMNQTRSDALSFGVLIAIWSGHPTYLLFEPVGLRGRKLLGLAIFGLLLLCLAAVSSSTLHFVWFQIGLVGLISAVLVFLASFNGDYLCPNGLFKRVMLWVGGRSYAIYLVHIPAYLLTREIWFRVEPRGTAFNSVFTLRFALTAAILVASFAELNYRFVEVPLRRRGRRIADRLARRPVLVMGG